MSAILPGHLLCLYTDLNSLIFMLNAIYSRSYAVKFIELIDIVMKQQLLITKSIVIGVLFFIIIRSYIYNYSLGMRMLILNFKKRKHYIAK